MRLRLGVSITVLLIISAVCLSVSAIAINAIVDSSFLGTKIFLAGFEFGRTQREWPLCVHEKWMDRCNFEAEKLRYSRDNPL